MRIYSRFSRAIEQVASDLQTRSYGVENDRWQSSDVSRRPGHKMREIFNTSFSVSLNHEDYRHYQDDIEPNLPWADDHFEERVGGLPLNPGKEWKNWPYALSADNFRTAGKSFSHSYMERYWPKHADLGKYVFEEDTPIQGIRYPYGDLSDVVELLHQDPETRQAYLPVWFPEDTGVVHGERVPCTLGYHFFYRMGYLHMTYYIRSCDFTRHFRDDLYLSLRLQLWILDQLRDQSEAFKNAKPGNFIFHCVSMHIFQNDFRALEERG